MYNNNVVSHLYQFLTKMCILIDSTKTRHPESGNGNGITETEYGIRERRFQAIDLKKNISNNNKIIKQIKKRQTVL